MAESTIKVYPGVYHMVGMEKNETTLKKGTIIALSLSESPTDSEPIPVRIRLTHLNLEDGAVTLSALTVGSPPCLNVYGRIRLARTGHSLGTLRLSPE